jgi:hypothetical protein
MEVDLELAATHQSSLRTLALRIEWRCAGGFQPHPSKRLGDIPTERFTIALNALALA